MTLFLKTFTTAKISDSIRSQCINRILIVTWPALFLRGHSSRPNKSARNASTADVDGWQPLIGIRGRGNGKRGKIPGGKKKSNGSERMHRYAPVWCNAVMNMYKITNGDGTKGTVTVLYRSARRGIPLVTVSPLFAAREPTTELRLISTTFRLFARPRADAARSGRGVREAYNNDIAIIALPIKISPDKASTRGFVSRMADKTTDAIARNIVRDPPRRPSSEVPLSRQKNGKTRVLAR